MSDDPNIIYKVDWHYIELRCDQGEDLTAIFLYDKDIKNLSQYKRKMKGSFDVRVDVKDLFHASISVVDFLKDSN